MSRGQCPVCGRLISRDPRFEGGEIPVSYKQVTVIACGRRCAAQWLTTEKRRDKAITLRGEQ